MTTNLFAQLAPIAAKTLEATESGSSVSLAQIRAMEVVGRLREGEEIGGRDLAQSWIALREAISQLGNSDSPYYIKDRTERKRVREELEGLVADITFYLTQTKRQPITTPREGFWGRVFGRTYERIPGPEEPLTEAEKSEAERISALHAQEKRLREQIAQKRYEQRYRSLTPAQKREVELLVADEMALRRNSGRVRELLEEEAVTPEQEVIDKALEEGAPEEKALAARAQKIEELRERILDLREQVLAIKTMAEFQQFLGLNEKVFSLKEMAKAVVHYLGFTGEKAQQMISNPDLAWQELFRQTGVMGLVPFVGKLFRYKLEKFATTKTTETPAEKPEMTTESGHPKELSSVGLS